VPLELGPEFEVLINDPESRFIVLGKLDLLPELVRQVRALRRLQVEEAVALLLEYGRVTGVR